MAAIKLNVLELFIWQLKFKTWRGKEDIFYWCSYAKVLEFFVKQVIY